MTFTALMTIISLLLMLFSLNWALQLMGYLQPVRVTVSAGYSRTRHGKLFSAQIEIRQGVQQWKPS